MSEEKILVFEHGVPTRLSVEIRLQKIRDHLFMGRDGCKESAVTHEEMKAWIARIEKLEEVAEAAADALHEWSRFNACSRAEIEASKEFALEGALARAGILDGRPDFNYMMPFPEHGEE